MESLLKKFTKKFFLSLGFKIIRTGKGIFGGLRKCAPCLEDEFKWFKKMDINTIIDVGSYKGESVLDFREILPSATIYAFEPLLSSFKELNANTKYLDNFKSFNIALGDKKEEKEIFRKDFSASTSLLEMHKTHEELFPFTSQGSKEIVRIDTLDNIVPSLDLKDNILLKIDVQGYEKEVLKGASGILGRVKIIIIEMSFCELYKDQLLFPEIYRILQNQGFTYSGSRSQLKSPIDGQPLQQDAIFIKYE